LFLEFDRQSIDFTIVPFNISSHEKMRNLHYIAIVVLPLVIEITSGQVIEPVMAALSVIPATQILASGGVLALKLAIASRILRSLGYKPQAEKLEHQFDTTTTTASSASSSENKEDFGDISAIIPPGILPMFGYSVNKDSTSEPTPPPTIKGKNGRYPAVLLPPNYEDYAPYQQPAPLPSSNDPKYAAAQNESAMPPMMAPILVDPSPDATLNANQTTGASNSTNSPFELVYPPKFNDTDFQDSKSNGTSHQSNPILNVLRPGYWSNRDAFGMPALNSTRNSTHETPFNP